MAILLVYLVILLPSEGTSAATTLNDQTNTTVKQGLGETVSLECVSDAQETPNSVFWRKLSTDGAARHDAYRQMSVNDNHLVIPNLQISDGGLYQCRALFGDETIQPILLRFIRLEVEVPNCRVPSFQSIDAHLNGNCSSNSTVAYRTTCSFECDDSSVLIGYPLLTCGINKTFDVPVPTCRGKRMFSLGKTHFADASDDVILQCAVVLKEEEEYTVYWYKCNKFDTNKTTLVSKDSHRQTLLGGRGYQIRNGKDLFIPHVSRNDSASYQCAIFTHEGYETYRHNISLFVRITCKMPTLDGALHTNTSTCRSEATIVEGTDCYFYCQTNFTLVGQLSARCHANGSLSEHIPNCKRTCKMPTLDGALHTNTSTCRSEANIVEGTDCYFYCQTNFTLVGQLSARCLANGSLSEHIPKCREELRSAPQHSKLLTTLTPVAIICIFIAVLVLVCRLRKRKRPKRYQGVNKPA